MRGGLPRLAASAGVIIRDIGENDEKTPDPTGFSVTDRCDKKALSGLPGFFGGYPRCVLTPAELDILENVQDINCSGLDLCEFEGQTRIYYANGDQMTYSFLCEAGVRRRP